MLTNSRVYWLKAIVCSFIASVFIYFRKLDYYKTIPRFDIKACLAVFVWSVFVFADPLFLPLGLIILNIYGHKHQEKDL